MDITFDLYTTLHHCFLLSWKSSKLFMNDLTWTLMWTPRDLNLVFVVWILREIYLFYMKSVYKYIDSIGKKVLNTLWILFCCTSNSKIKSKFSMNLLAKQLFDDVTSSSWVFWNMFEQMLFKKYLNHRWLRGK